jgi:hypothetical protein
VTIPGAGKTGSSSDQELDRPTWTVQAATSLTLFGRDAIVRTFILITLLATGIFVADTSQAEDAPALPACDAKEAIEIVKETITNDALKELADVQVLDHGKLSEISFDAKEGVRSCVGDFVLNRGNETFAYVFGPAKSDPTKVLVQVQALDPIQAYLVWALAERHNGTPEQKAQEPAPGNHAGANQSIR